MKNPFHLAKDCISKLCKLPHGPLIHDVGFGNVNRQRCPGLIQLAAALTCEPALKVKPVRGIRLSVIKDENDWHRLQDPTTAICLTPPSHCQLPPRDQAKMVRALPLNEDFSRLNLSRLA